MPIGKNSLKRVANGGYSNKRHTNSSYSNSGYSSAGPFALRSEGIYKHRRICCI